MATLIASVVVARLARTLFVATRLDMLLLSLLLTLSERPCAGDIAYAISVAVNVSVGEAFAALNIYFF